LVYNSSFEVYLQDENTGIKTPSFWSGGVCSADASFHGTHSLKLEPSETTVQNAGTHPYINPTWYESTQTRISWHSKLGEVSIRVWDRTNSGSVLSYFTLYADNLDTPLSGTSITFPSNPNWLDSRDTIYFDPNESGHEGCQSFAIEFTNDSVSEDCYIDAVQCHPDFTGKWSQLYKDGPYSATAAEIGDFTTSVTTILVDSDVRPIYVQDAEPTAPVAKDIWVDTNDYSRYDVYLAGASATLLMAGQEVVVATASGITLTLESPTQSGVVKKIKNDSNGTITVSGTIDNLSTKMLFPNESLSLVSGNSKWLIM
jgi:hypothetical protein